jgi:hypothetical protein
MKKTNRLWALLLGAVWASFAFADYQPVIDAREVQASISRAHADWKAKESWVTRLSREDLNRLLGLKNPPRGSLQPDPMNRLTRETVDWRDMNGVNWLGNTLNQGNCGSCVAFATVATLEAQLSIASGVTWMRPEFSPQQLFNCGGGLCGWGWEPEDAANFLTTTGITDSACLPYTSGSTGQDVACSLKCADAADRTFKIAGFTRPTTAGGYIDTIRTALKKGPLVTTLNVYGDFLTYASGVYRHVTGAFVGGHAVSIVGFSDEKQAWLVRNSWGEEWGEKGYIWISWSDTSGIGYQTWALTMPTSSKFVAVTSPSERSYVSGRAQIAAKAIGANLMDVKFRVKLPSGNTLAAISCSVSTPDGCAGEVDTTGIPDGRYEVYSESAGAKSMVREFYVLNTAPKMEIKVTPATGVNLGAPVNGRPEFDVVANYAPVPIESLELRVMDPSGKIVSRKGSPFVTPQMTIGWRTLSVPDGDYTLSIHGETKVGTNVYAVDSNVLSLTVKN